MAEILSAESVEIVEISIRSERFLEGKSLFLAGRSGGSVGVELEIYENIYMPYLTGNLLVQDDNDIYRIAQIQGTERVHVLFHSPGSPTLIEKVFIITNVQKSIKVNDNLSQLLLELIEDHGYFDGLEKINKAYNGTGVEIIEKILNDTNGKTIKQDYFKLPAQKSFRYIIPWLTGYEAIGTVLNFITTDNSLPYFFYSSLTSDDLILTDYESILEREPFNSNNMPFTYSTGIIQKMSLDRDAFLISDYKANDLNDTLALANSGAVGSSFESIDTLSGADVDIRIDMEQEYLKLSDVEIIDPRLERFPIDNKFRVDGNQEKSITEYNTKKYSVMAHSPYDDINGMIPDYLTSRQIVVKNNFQKYLNDNSYMITVPGLAFGVKHTDRSVGHQINVNIYKDGHEDDKPNIIDERKSGTFTMIAKKHVFDLVSETHNVVIKIGRLTEPTRIE